MMLEQIPVARESGDAKALRHFTIGYAAIELLVLLAVSAGHGWGIAKEAWPGGLGSTPVRRSTRFPSSSSTRWRWSTAAAPTSHDILRRGVMTFAVTAAGPDRGPDRSGRSRYKD